MDDEPEFITTPEQMAEHLQKLHMAQSGMSHKMHDVFDGMDKDQLITLTQIYAMIAAGDQSRTAAYFDGFVSKTLQAKFSICPVCKVDHDEMLDEQREQVQSDLTEDHSKPWHQDPVVIQMMDEYNVEPALPEDRNCYEVKCKGCGTVSPNLDDRMLARPGVDGCSNCKQKAAWG